MNHTQNSQEFYESRNHASPDELAYRSGVPDYAGADDIDRVSALAAIRSVMYLPDFDNNPFVSDYEREEIFAQAESLVANADAQTVRDAVEFLMYATIGGIEVTETLGRGHFDKFTQLWNILLREPETARALVSNQIVGFHGTKSGALMSIMRRGYLQSAYESLSVGTPVITGERFLAPSDGHDYVFFGDWGSPDTIGKYTVRKGPISLEDMRRELFERRDELDNWNGPDWQKPIKVRMAQSLEDEIEFIELNPLSIEAQLMLANIPISFGLSMKGFTAYERPNMVPDSDDAKQNAIIEFPFPVSTIMGEFAIARRVGLNRMPVLAAPKENVDWLQHVISLSEYPQFQVIPDDILRLFIWQMPQPQFS